VSTPWRSSRPTSATTTPTLPAASATSPSSWPTQGDLATILADQGDLDRARTLHERALAVREARLGADHPDAVRSRQRLAAVVAALDEQS
jgi:hypothetical protein